MKWRPSKNGRGMNSRGCVKFSGDIAIRDIRYSPAREEIMEDMPLGTVYGLPPRLDELHHFRVFAFVQIVEVIDHLKCQQKMVQNTKPQKRHGEWRPAVSYPLPQGSYSTNPPQGTNSTNSSSRPIIVIHDTSHDDTITYQVLYTKCIPYKSQTSPGGWR